MCALQTTKQGAPVAKAANPAVAREILKALVSASKDIIAMLARSALETSTLPAALTTEAHALALPLRRRAKPTHVASRPVNARAEVASAFQLRNAQPASAAQVTANRQQAPNRKLAGVAA